jgi:hypothetical protein
VLAGDGQLRVVQRAELTGGQPPFRLELEETQIGPAGKRARLLGHGSPSLRRPRVRDIGLERHAISG